VETLYRLLIQPLEDFYGNITKFLPTLLTSFLILLLGITLGISLKVIFQRVFRAIKLDSILEQSGLAELLRKCGMRETISVLLAKLVGWLTFFVFALIAMNTLQVYGVSRLFEKFLLYLPHFFAALLILLAGYLFSNFLYRAALIAAVNAGNKAARLIGKTVKYGVILLAVTMALEQLGIGKETVVIAFAIIFGGVVFAFALAFGLGAKDLMKTYLEKQTKQEDHKDEIDYL
jgi:hypothetical protein